MLTPNAIVRLNDGDSELRPNLQVMDIRQIGNSQSAQERFRLVLSDGKHVQQAMLATQLNEFVKSGQVRKGSIVQLLEFICNTVQARKIIIVLNMEVVATEHEIVGDPKTLVSGLEAPATTVGASVGTGTVQKQQQLGQQQQHPPPQQQHRGIPPSIPATMPLPHQASYANLSNGSFKSTGAAGLPAVNGGVNAVDNEDRYASSMARRPGPQGTFTGQRVTTGAPGLGASFGGAGAGGQYGQSSYPKPASAYQPPAMYSAKGPISKNEAPARIVPIAALNPYQGRWTIKARVTAKGEIRRFHNAKGDGKVFHFDLLDADGGEIRATCFNNVADQFYDRIEVGKVYLVTKGALKAAQRAFNHLKNEWEIFLENTSTIELSYEEDQSIPQQVFDFKPISDVENTENNAMVDVIGIVITIQSTASIMRKNGTEALKRTLQMRDRSGRSVELTMWGNFCSKEGQVLQELCDSGQFPVLAVKAGRVSDFSGKSVGTISSTQLLINPDIADAHRLRDWFDREGRLAEPVSISKEGGTGTRAENRKAVSQIKDEGLGRAEKPDWITIRATISFIKTDSFCYTACPSSIGDRQCNKKVTNNGDGTWRCDRCDRSVSECDYRYLLNIQVQDHTGVTWITAFQEAGEELLGVSAKELQAWKLEENSRFADTVQNLLFSTYLLKLKVKEEVYNDEQKVKCSLLKSDKLDFSSESKLLLDCIRRLEGGELAGAVSFPSSTTTSTGGYRVGSSGHGSMISGGPHAYSGFGGGGSGFSGGSGGFGGGNSFSTSAGMYGGSGVAAGAKCFKCQREGHFANACPNEPSSIRGDGSFGGGSTGGACYKCGQGGHFARDCPNQGGGRGFGGGGGGGMSSMYDRNF